MPRMRTSAAVVALALLLGHASACDDASEPTLREAEVEEPVAAEDPFDVEPPPIGPDNPAVEADPNVDESNGAIALVSSQFPAGLDHWPSAEDRVSTYLADSDVVYVVSGSPRIVGSELTEQAHWQLLEIDVSAARGASVGVHTVRFEPNSEIRSLDPPEGGQFVVGCKNDDGFDTPRVVVVLPWDGEATVLGEPQTEVPLNATQVLGGESE